VRSVTVEQRESVLNRLDGAGESVVDHTHCGAAVAITSAAATRVFSIMVS